MKKSEEIRLTIRSFFSKGQLAYGGSALRPVSPGLGRTDLGHRPRNPDLVARQRSSRRGVTRVEEIPRRPQRRAAPATLVSRAEPTSRPATESKLRETLVEEERRSAVRPYARLLLLPTILWHLRHRLLCRRYSGERRCHHRSQFGSGADRIDQVAGQRVGRVRVGQIRQKEAIDRFRMLDDHFHGDFVGLFIDRGQRVSRERQRPRPSHMHTYVHSR